MKYPKDTFFKNFEPSFEGNLHVKSHYQMYNDAFAELDSESWKILKGKPLGIFSITGLVS